MKASQDDLGHMPYGDDELDEINVINEQQQQASTPRQDDSTSSVAEVKKVRGDEDEADDDEADDDGMQTGGESEQSDDEEVSPSQQQEVVSTTEIQKQVLAEIAKQQNTRPDAPPRNGLGNTRRSSTTSTSTESTICLKAKAVAKSNNY